MFMAYAVRKKCHAGIISRNGLRKLIAADQCSVLGFFRLFSVVFGK